ncbi:Recombination-associated protein RdgC [Georgfuchsia toluolica]|uniref:Recombination-associated protein RdgC n=1 Tax=Georgfuchsia toluolica TaxID=424218 RepID=A0A916NIJ5_9PROT|nr:recombination-associated protein RdgC [Georgfuchsia toluolica]CAG4884606.1 Recombination-associated protein RdgC [Georgfuchsia toluolica]
MWFRNLRIYRLSSNWKDSRQLNDLLAKKPLTRCGSLDMISRGWVYPKHEDFVHAVNGQWLVALGVEQKLLPATVIRQETQERAAVIEAEQERTLGRKERRELRDRVALELLPKAFTRRRTTWGWIDPVSGWLVIDAGSDARAEEFLEVFLPLVGEVQLRPLQTRLSPMAAMTEWLASDDAPVGFTIDDELELRAAALAQSAIRYVKHALEGREIRQHIANGKSATKLGVTWNDKLSFVLTDKFQIKRLAFLDILKETTEQSALDAEEQFDTDFALMAGELGLMFQDLLVALGGELEPAD